MKDLTNESIVMEAALTDSISYQFCNPNGELTSLIMTAVKDSIVIDRSYIEEQILQIQRTRISPLADSVLKAYENGDITLLYSKVVKVPQALPFFVTKIKGKIKAFIFVNNYGTISKGDGANKFLNVPMKDLYVLMEGAYTAFHYAVYPNQVTKSMALMKVSCSIYTTMILRILNKDYAISMDQDVYSKITFCISKFFLERVWMYTNKDVIFTYAKNNIKNAVNSAEFIVISKLYEEANILTISDLLNFITQFSPRLKGLSFRYFLQCYIDRYKNGAMFGLECLPYFLYTIEASMIGSFLVNQPMISDITKNTKGMNTFYPELVKVLS